MKHDVARVKSLHVLQRLLAPLVTLHVSRLRRRKTANSHKSHLPSLDVLKSLPLLMKWPSTALQSWTANGVVEAHARGTVVAFAGEPRRAADVFWLLSGTLAQIPSKAELRVCAGDLVHLSRSLPKTGPLVLPTHFMNEGGARKDLPPLTAAQERLADSLSFYHAGQLVDMERLILGGERRRALRCQSDVVVLRLSLAAFLCEIQTLPDAVRSATINAARQEVQHSMAQFSGPPSTPAIMAANPVLAALPPAVLKSICLQLEPCVFLQSETICENVFAAEWMYFLSSGQVRTADSSGANARLVATPDTVIGLNAFVQSCVPDHFDQKSRATAATYCEMWGLPLPAVLSACDGASRTQCAWAAVQQVRAQGFGRLPIATALRAYACFADLSEIAVAAIARVLRVRVYTPGETVAAAGRIPAFGLLVVAGDVRLRRSRERESQQLPPGQAHFFCESLVRMCVSESVVSQSSSIVLQGTPAVLLEAMEMAGVAADETALLLRSAQAYVDRFYGADSIEIIKAQYTAAERVREYKRRLMEATHAAQAVPLQTATTTAALQNELLASLEVQLHALHPDEDEVTKFEYFRVGKTATHDDGAATVVCSPLPFEASRRSAYFTLDEQGNLITHDATCPPTNAAHPPEPSRAVSTLEQRVEIPPPSFVSPCPPLRPPPLSTVRGKAKTKQKSASLHAASLRSAVSRMKAEADGVDQRKDGRGYPVHHSSR